jgi:hypothetical protein
LSLRSVTLLALTVVSALGLAGCSKGADSPSNKKHFFEGNVEWRGLSGRPPGKPWSMRCTVRHEDLLCDVSLGRSSFQLGFRGPGNTICFRGGRIGWIPISLQTVAMIFAFLPEDVRHEAVQKTQAQYRFTGQRENHLGRTCEVVEIRDSKGAFDSYCYSDEEFFEGDQKLIPLLHQMGFEAGFISDLGKYGMAWRVQATKPSGEPSLVGEVTKLEPHDVDPAAFAGVCGQP